MNQIKCDTGTGEKYFYCRRRDESLINGSPLPIRLSFPIPILQSYILTPTTYYPIQPETPENMDAERRRCQVPITKYQGIKKVKRKHVIQLWKNKNLSS